MKILNGCLVVLMIVSTILLLKHIIPPLEKIPISAALTLIPMHALIGVKIYLRLRKRRSSNRLTSQRGSETEKK